MTDLMSLKEPQLDALRETANIGAGHAATALSQMTGGTIMISVPTITIAALEDVPSQIDDGEEPSEDRNRFSEFAERSVPVCALIRINVR